MVADSAPVGHLRLGRYLMGSRSNGPCLRDVLWTAGCTIRCAGCVNPEWWSPTSGIEVAVQSICALLVRRAGIIEGITLSGGEPTEQAEAAARVACHAQSLGLGVVLFTGRSLAACEANPLVRSLLEHCDAVVAGPFVANAPRGRRLVGSANQRLHLTTSRYTDAQFSNGPDAELRLSLGLDVVTTGVLR